MSDRGNRVSSPCVAVCALDENDVCIGCHRTGDEILHWTRMSDEQKRDVLRKVSEREQRSLI